MTLIKYVISHECVVTKNCGPYIHHKLSIEVFCAAAVSMFSIWVLLCWICFRKCCLHWICHDISW